jgi:hypothetical protein
VDIAVDCCLLLELKNAEIDVVRFVSRLLDPRYDHRVLLDHERAIEREYEAHVDRARPDLYTEVVQQLLYTPSNFYKYSGRPCSHLARRLEEIGFHQKDRPYVGVASRSPHKRVASIDSRSFGDPTKRQCLESEFGLRIVDRSELDSALA